VILSDGSTCLELNLAGWADFLDSAKFTDDIQSRSYCLGGASIEFQMKQFVSEGVLPTREAGVASCGGHDESSVPHCVFTSQPGHLGGWLLRFRLWQRLLLRLFHGQLRTGVWL
jgi:hypothetical protein